MEWSEETSLRLIEFYKQKKLLWNTRHPDHFNKSQRSEAWDDIAKKMGVTAEDAKKKMGILLASMRREKSKFKRSLQSGSEEKFKSTWFAFKSLQFMWDRGVRWHVAHDTYSVNCLKHEIHHNYTHRLMPSLLAASSCSSVSVFKDSPSDDDLHLKDLSENVSTQESQPEDEERDPLRPDTPLPHTTTAPQTKTFPQRQKKSCGLSLKRDFFTVYGEFVGDSIRNLHNNRVQSWARHHINNVIYLAEQASFQNSTKLPTVDNLNISIDPSSSLLNFSPNASPGFNPNRRERTSNSPLPSPSSSSFRDMEPYIKEEPSYSDPLT